MEAFATVQVVSSIVQLVDFGSKCLCKGLKLYHSSPEGLDEDLAVEATVARLTILNNKVRTATTSLADPSLQALCDQITDTATELLNALEKVKVVGKKTRWTCMRQAIKSVWGKEKIAGVESRLAGFRNELNLQICILIKERLEGVETRTTTRFDDCDARTREILDALMNNRDMFQSALTDQTVLLQGFETDVRKHLHDNQTCLRRDIRTAASDTQIANLHEHHDTRVIVQAEGDRILNVNAVSLQILDAHVQATIESRAEEDSFQHQQTQKHIADLQSQLLQLSEQIKQRDHEFREVLVSVRAATSTKKRKLLRERSNAIAATILALQIMCSHPRMMLEALKANVIDWAQWSRACAESRRTQTSLPVQMNTWAHHQQVDPYELNGQRHGSRLSKEYDWLTIRIHLIDPEILRRRWSTPDDRSQDGRYNVPIFYRTVWLLSIVHAVLLRNFAESTAALDLLSEVLINHSDGNLKNLEKDLQYFTEFAELRKMLETSAEHARINLKTLTAVETAEVLELLGWMVGTGLRRYDSGYIGLHLISEGAASRLAQDAIAMGLQMTINPSIDDLTCKKNAGFMVLRCGVMVHNSRSSTSALQLTPCSCEPRETLIPAITSRKFYPYNHP